MEAIRDHLGDQGGVAAGAIVDYEIHLDLVFCRLIDNPGGVLNHFWVQHAGDHFVEREGFGIGFLIAYQQRNNEWDSGTAS